MKTQIPEFRTEHTETHLKKNCAKPKISKNIQQAARERKKLSHSRTIRLSLSFSLQNLEARRELDSIISILKDKACQSALYPANCFSKLFFRYEGEGKIFLSIYELKEFDNTNPVLQELLREVSHQKKQQRNFNSDQGHNYREKQTERYD